MSESPTRDDIRRLLKMFGVQADEQIIRHLERTRGGAELHLRCTLEDITDYGDTPPDEPLHLEIEGVIRRADD